MNKSITPFVILFHSRSGSTYLISMLKTHPEMHAYGEMLVDDGLAAQLKKTRRTLQPDHDLPSEIKAVGFKVKFSDLRNFDLFGDLLTELGSKVIFLHRQNTVKRVLSDINARRLYKSTGKWNLRSEADRLGRFTIDPDAFDRRLRREANSNSSSADKIAKLNLPTLTFTYEDLLVSVGDVMPRIFDFLQVSHMELQPGTLKNTSDDLRQVVDNFDELRDRYIGTEYEPMFDEVLLPDAMSGSNH